MEGKQSASGGLCSCVGLTLDTEQGTILFSVRYSHAGKGSTSVRCCGHFLFRGPSQSPLCGSPGQRQPDCRLWSVGFLSGTGPWLPSGVWGTSGFSLRSPGPPALDTPCFMSLSQPACLFLSIARSRSVMTGEQMAAFHPPATPNPLERPIKMGWLKKQRSIVKNWQQRYFVLRAQQLYYYKDEEDSKPQVPAGCVSLPRAPRSWAGAHWLLSFL